jgi:TorA maturation chaperone TorD
MSDDAMHQIHADGIAIAAEDAGRAEVYAVLGNLFSAPPSKRLLEMIATGLLLCNDASLSDFCQAWRALQQAAGKTDAEAAKDEYEAAFLGPGRQAVMLYGSYHASGFLHEKPLAQLREDLAKMGLGRQDDRHESEDHVSALCDVMRLLIAGDGDLPPAAPELQRDFFRRHIGPWYQHLCSDLAAAPQTNFYKHAAAAMREFFALEDEAFDMT